MQEQTEKTITKLACLLRAAHCTLDVLANRLDGAEKERVMELCQAMRNTYTEAFERNGGAG